MKKLLIASLMLVLSGYSFGDWLYSGSTLTECDSTGTPLTEGAWVFKVTEAKVGEDGVYQLQIVCQSVGTAAKLDFSSKIWGERTAVIAKLGLNCLDAKTTITEVKLPETLRTIGSQAFRNTSNLEKVEPFLSDSVTYVGSNAFKGSGVAGALRLGHGGNSVTLDTSAFYATPITSVDFGSGVTSLPQSIFQGCSSLTSVKVSESLTSIASQAFFGCGSLVSMEPFLPDGVTSVGQKAFQNVKIANPLRIGHGGVNVSLNNYCFFGTDIPSLDIGPGVTSLPGWGFQDCSKLTSIKLPETLTSLASQAIAYCGALESIEPFLPPSVVTIGSRAFAGNSSITHGLSLGGNEGAAYNINAEAFYRSGNFSSITLGAGITNILSDTFKPVSGATEIRFLCDRPAIGSTAFYRDSRYHGLNIKVYLPKNLPGWSAFIDENVVPWNEVDETEQAKYYENFGEGAPPPDGKIIETDSSMGQMRNQWYFGFSTVAGLVIILS